MAQAPFISFIVSVLGFLGPILIYLYVGSLSKKQNILVLVVSILSGAWEYRQRESEVSCNITAFGGAYLSADVGRQYQICFENLYGPNWRTATISTYQNVCGPYLAPQLVLQVEISNRSLTDRIIGAPFSIVSKSKNLNYRFDSLLQGEDFDIFKPFEENHGLSNRKIVQPFQIKSGEHSSLWYVLEINPENSHPQSMGEGRYEITLAFPSEDIFHTCATNFRLKKQHFDSQVRMYMNPLIFANTGLPAEKL